MFIDAKGKACPMPVIMAREALEGGCENLTVQVDNTTAVENLTRMGNSLGLSVESGGGDGEYSVHFKGKAAVKAEEGGSGVAVFVNSDSIGDPGTELGHNLMRMALYTMSTWKQPPCCLMFMNTGVKLASPAELQAQDSLRQLIEKGARVLVCGTCLNFYGIAGDSIVGQVSNMQDILEAMKEAGKVIAL